MDCSQDNRNIICDRTSAPTIKIRCVQTVSYTHLDVYKRQVINLAVIMLLLLSSYLYYITENHNRLRWLLCDKRIERTVSLNNRRHFLNPVFFTKVDLTFSHYFRKKTMVTVTVLCNLLYAHDCFACIQAYKRKV